MIHAVTQTFTLCVYLERSKRCRWEWSGLHNYPIIPHTARLMSTLSIKGSGHDTTHSYKLFQSFVLVQCLNDLYIPEALSVLLYCCPDATISAREHSIAPMKSCLVVSSTRCLSSTSYTANFNVCTSSKRKSTTKVFENWKDNHKFTLTTCMALFSYY